ncbi:MAG TPA: NUDIX hydrolase [Rectinemataceae bacterium]|nr:NUDIX hydrolase [Rectinemataceae bacterium]
MLKPGNWRETARRDIADCRVFEVSSSERESADGRKGTFYLVNAHDWAGVIPVVDTPTGRMIVMIRQYRHGTGRLCLEFPGGAIERGEDPAKAVARELTEETGYQAEMIVPLGLLSPNPAFMTNAFHAFVAEGCSLVHEQRLDELEEIEVSLVPEREAIDLVGAEDYGHALMTAALFLYMRYRGFSL